MEGPVQSQGEAARGEPPSSLRYRLKPVVKPLRGGKSPAGSQGVQAAAFLVRAENEDDDGYDPYSDFHDGTAGEPSFEADPWR